MIFFCAFCVHTAECRPYIVGLLDEKRFENQFMYLLGIIASTNINAVGNKQFSFIQTTPLNGNKLALI